jgi:NitT/TauT family transport system ATP-binding protein
VEIGEAVQLTPQRNERGTSDGPGSADGSRASAAVADPAVAVEARGINLRYRSPNGTTVHAVKDANLTVGRREFVALLGPSGCGKSSLLRVLCGLTPPSEGTVSYDGQVIKEPPRAVGLVPQAATLLPWLRVIDNVMLPAKILKLSKDEAQTRAHELLDLVGLSKFERSYPRELSGGMQQRVSIARALIHDPKILLMDEPFAALDALTRDRMAVELQSTWMSTQKAVVFVTHSIPEAVFLADRIVLMSARPGRIVAEFRPEAARPRRIDHADEATAQMTAEIRGLLENEAERVDA